MGSNLILLIEVCVVYSLLVISVKFGPFLIRREKGKSRDRGIGAGCYIDDRADGELSALCQLYVTCFDYLTAARPLAV